MSIFVHRCTQLSAILCVFLLSGCQTNPNRQALLDQNADLQAEAIPNQRLKTSNFDEALEKARKAWTEHKTDFALAYYVQAFKLQPTHTEVLEELAEVYRFLHKQDLVAICYRLILEQQPERTAILERYGLLLLLDEQKLAEAKEVLLKVVTATPESRRANNGLGIIADIEGRHSEARAYFKLAMPKHARSDDPVQAELLNNIGYSYYMDEQLDIAQSYFLQAIKVDPKFTKSVFNYALVLARLKNYSQALTAFSKVVEPPEANNNTGYIALMNDDLAEADYYLKQALKLSPSFYQKAHENLYKLNSRKVETSSD